MAAAEDSGMSQARGPAPAAASGADSEPRDRHLLSFIGAVRFNSPSYSLGVRQAVFRRFNATPGFYLRERRGEKRAGGCEAGRALELGGGEGGHSS